MTVDLEYKLQQVASVYNVDFAFFFFILIYFEGQTYHLLPSPPDQGLKLFLAFIMVQVAHLA